MGEGSVPCLNGSDVMQDAQLLNKQKGRIVMSRWFARPLVITSIVAAAALALPATAAVADEDIRVGAACQEVQESDTANRWEICDTQYDSTNLPGYRSHVLSARSLDNCPALHESVRLRGSVESYYDATVESVEAEGAYCPELHLTVSGKSSSGVNVSLTTYPFPSSTNTYFAPF